MASSGRSGSGWRSSRLARHAGFLGGWLLILISPLVGLVPGPGGVFVFAAGAALVLKTSVRAKRWYVRAKRRWPRLGDWVDWGLRRASHRRRQRLCTAGWPAGIRRRRAIGRAAD